MTGRRLYDLYCDGVRGQLGSTVWDPRSRTWVERVLQLAWPELSVNERATWNVVAKRVPKR